MPGSVSLWRRSILFKIFYLSRSNLLAVELAVNTHLRHSTIFFCELDAASRFVVSAQPRRYSTNGKHDILLGQNRTPDLGALRLGNPNVIRIAADRFSNFSQLGKILANLCPLWLGMSGIGYLGTGLAVRSRTLLAASLFHLLGILILPYTGGLSFLFTGTVLVFSLLVLAELQWDMRQPINRLH